MIVKYMQVKYYWREPFHLSMNSMILQLQGQWLFLPNHCSSNLSMLGHTGCAWVHLVVLLVLLMYLKACIVFTPSKCCHFSKRKGTEAGWQQWQWSISFSICLCYGLDPTAQRYSQEMRQHYLDRLHYGKMTPFPKTERRVPFHS